MVLNIVVIETIIVVIVTNFIESLILTTLSNNVCICVFSLQFLKNYMDSSDEEIPEAVLIAAAEANLNLLPAKSKERYQKQFVHFVNWCESMKVRSYKEEVFLAYFLELSKVLKSNTLWSRYSMIKSLMKIKHNIDISKFYKLTTFLKKQNIGFRTQKANIFSKEDIAFMLDAPNEIYLMIKVVTIFGLSGACRRAELTKITLDDIEDKGNLIIVKITDSKNNSARSFVVSEEINNGMFLKLYREYVSLRPSTTTHRRLFIKYQKGKCTVQCVGINTFGKIPSEIAAFLHLPNPERYTGHSYRSSSATFLADSGETITNIKRLGGWKTTSVAEGYLEDSEKQKRDVCNKILSIDSLEPSTSTSSDHSEHRSRENTQCQFKDQLASVINLQNAANCSFIFNITKQ